MLNTILLDLTELAQPELFGIKIFDEDFYKLVSLFGLNVLITFIIGRLIYYPFNGKKKEFLFAYLLIAATVFFLCFALKAFKFNTGVAIGLFALLGIIRFRTNPVPIKDMSYLFIFIGLSMINAFSKKMSIYEIVFINFAAITVLYFMELFLKGKKIEKPASIELVYGNIANTKPEKREELKSELSAQLGIEIERVKIGKMNLKTQEVEIKVYYIK
ncbi:MAG: DUF4956 domain-containing protein [Flavobacteriales bacterium]